MAATLWFEMERLRPDEEEIRPNENLVSWAENIQLTLCIHSCKMRYWDYLEELTLPKINVRGIYHKNSSARVQYYYYYQVSADFLGTIRYNKDILHGNGVDVFANASNCHSKRNATDHPKVFPLATMVTITMVWKSADKLMYIYNQICFKFYE